MQKLIVFNHISLDGYFVDANGDMSWAHADLNDTEWNAFVAGNARGHGVLVFGRITYEMMASFWPSPRAMQMIPAVAEGMNQLAKIVFSKTLHEASWNNTRLITGDLIAEMRKLKQESSEGLVILGSGSLVAQLAAASLIDEYQIVMNPIALGKGRTLFEGMKERLRLKLTQSRVFGNGKTLLTYEPV